jgi:hypothetical protein
MSIIFLNILKMLYLYLVEQGTGIQYLAVCYHPLAFPSFRDAPLYRHLPFLIGTGTSLL